MAQASVFTPRLTNAAVTATVAARTVRFSSSKRRGKAEEETARDDQDTETLDQLASVSANSATPVTWWSRPKQVPEYEHKEVPPGVVDGPPRGPPFQLPRPMSDFPERVYYAVAYEYMEFAKACGAVFCGTHKAWYGRADQRSIISELDRTFVRVNHETEVELTQEELAFGGDALTVDWQPSTAWYAKGVPAIVHLCDWRRLQNHVYSRAGWRCECCGARHGHTALAPVPGPGAPDVQLRVHGRWRYDEDDTQKLMRLMALCRECLRVARIERDDLALAQKGECDELAVQHHSRVAGISREEAQAATLAAFALRTDRSKRKWTPDITLLTSAGIATVQSMKQVAAALRKETAAAAAATKGLRRARRVKGWQGC